MPKKGHGNETIADDSARDYIYKYYNSMRPHSHNFGLPPNKKEKLYWKISNSATKNYQPLKHRL